ncbi:hypothetical protein ACOSP7_025922 [Xanthoceras sorbifolium]
MAMAFLMLPTRKDKASQKCVAVVVIIIMSHHHHPNPCLEIESSYYMNGPLLLCKADGEVLCHVGTHKTTTYSTTIRQITTSCIRFLNWSWDHFAISYQNTPSGLPCCVEGNFGYIRLQQVM